MCVCVCVCVRVCVCVFLFSWVDSIRGQREVEYYYLDATRESD